MHRRADAWQTMRCRRRNSSIKDDEPEGRALLTSELERIGLTCVTEEQLVELGHFACCSTIDYICLDSDLATCVQPVGAWEPGRGGSVRLSGLAESKWLSDSDVAVVSAE